MEQHGAVSAALASPTTSSSSSSSRMEDLPVEIRVLVISLMSLKEAARTSIVSRNWRKLWTCYCDLCFDGTIDGPINQDTVKIEKANFIETVNSIIQQHSGPELNKFSIRYNLRARSADHLDRWICFAAASKAKIIDLNLWPKINHIRPSRKVHHFPLEALGVQDGPFIQYLSLTHVCIKPRSNISGFTKLRRLRLHCVQIVGDLPGFLLNCSILEDLEVVACSGVTDLDIPHRLDKLRHLLISNMRIRMVDFHVTGLTHFWYQGVVIPIALHGCSNLEKATLLFLYEDDSDKALGHAISGILGISAVKVLHVRAYMNRHQPVWSSQVPKLTARPTCMYDYLRHLTCEITIYRSYPNNHTGILQLAHYLDLAPQLETLQLHMYYLVFGEYCWHGEEGSPHMRRLDHLKTVYMSGFRCYRPQVELLCGILENGAALEHVTIEPMVTLDGGHIVNRIIPEREICEWAHQTSERFGKSIIVVKAPRQR